MAVVVYIESQDGVIKKAGLEVASYGRSIADDQAVSYTHLTLPTILLV